MVTREVVDSAKPVDALMSELELEVADRQLPPNVREQFVQLAREIDRKRYTFRSLGDLLELSHTTVRKLAMKR